MHKKLKLNMDELAVESFVVESNPTAFGTAIRGGIGGRQDDNFTGMACSETCTVEAQETCGLVCNTFAVACATGGPAGPETHYPTFGYTCTEPVPYTGGQGVSCVYGCM